jgi:hypothetical protein
MPISIIGSALVDGSARGSKAVFRVLTMPLLSVVVFEKEPPFSTTHILIEGIVEVLNTARQWYWVNIGLFFVDKASKSHQIAHEGAHY